MGLYDRVELDPHVHLPGFDRQFDDTDSADVAWQTKSIGRPHMGRYRITDAGELLMAEFHSESVPEAERPHYDEGIGGFEHELEAMAGMLRTVHDGWSRRDYHGTFEFTGRIDDTRVRYEATFTHGRLESLERIDENGPGAKAPRADVLTWTETRTDDPLVEETVVEGFLSDDHECDVLFPENRMSSSKASDGRGYCLRELLPPGARSGKHRFRITVEATPVANHRSASGASADEPTENDH